MSAARTLLLSFVLVVGCGAKQTPEGTLAPAPGSETSVTFEKRPVAKTPPPQSGEKREVKFPKIVRSRTANGLELNVVELTQLPVVQILLVVRSGSAEPELVPCIECSERIGKRKSVHGPPAGLAHCHHALVLGSLDVFALGLEDRR